MSKFKEFDKIFKRLEKAAIELGSDKIEAERVAVAILLRGILTKRDLQVWEKAEGKISKKKSSKKTTRKPKKKAKKKKNRN